MSRLRPKMIFSIIWYAKSSPALHRSPLHQTGAANCSLLNLVAVLFQYDAYQLTGRPHSGFRKESCADIANRTEQQADHRFALGQITEGLLKNCTDQCDTHNPVTGEKSAKK